MMNPDKTIGLILDAQDMSYETMRKAGKVTIEFNETTGKVEIHVEGFDYNDPQSCRTFATRSIAWARDVLSSEIEACRLTPGGHITTAVD